MWRKHTYLWNVHEVEVVVTDSVNVLLFVYTPGMTLLISMFDVLYLVCLCGGDQGRRRTFSTVAGACALRASQIRSAFRV